MVETKPESGFDVVEWSRGVKREIGNEMAAGTFRPPSLEELSEELGVPLRVGSPKMQRRSALARSAKREGG